jgi:hypothetical protein
MWGIPVAASAYGIGKFWPGGIENYYDDVRSYAMSHGINIDHNKLIEFLHKGAIDSLVTTLTGTHYAIAKNLGPGVENPSISDLPKLLTDPASVMKDFLGPVPSFITSVVSQIYPFMTGTYTADGVHNFQVTHEELLDVAREISSVNNAYNSWMAFNYQKAVARNHEVLISPNDVRTTKSLMTLEPIPPMSKTDAVMALFGINRQDASDVRLTQQILRDVKDKEDWIKKQAMKPLRDYYNSVAEGDMVAANAHMGRAMSMLSYYGDINNTEVNKLKDQVLKDLGGSVATRVQEQWTNINKMPQSQIPARMRRHWGIELENR